MKEYVLVKMSKNELTELIKSAVESSVKHLNFELVKPKRLIKIEQLCEELSVSKATIHKWKRDGLIPYKRISNRIFFDLDDVHKSLEIKKRRI